MLAWDVLILVAVAAVAASKRIGNKELLTGNRMGNRKGKAAASPWMLLGAYILLQKGLSIQFHKRV